ncbi:MAG: pseudouridine synthase [Reichenbachiella sp.]|uniref:RluA family pseudouridine synthase n=1 Tax=Reichenbachiella sp. TaxID=2184521 RepID=UPI0032663374
MSEQVTIKNRYFTQFEKSIEGVALPDNFTYPFFYEPHPLCLLAAEQLQDYLQNQTEWQHDFGIDHFVDGVNVGKMFGVLLVQNDEGETGFLSAFSGKLAGKHHQPGFVPPVVDYLVVDSFFRKGEKEIEKLTAAMETLEKSKEYTELQADNRKQKLLAERELNASKIALKAAKKTRKARREEAQQNLNVTEYEKLVEDLKAESLEIHYKDKDLNRHWKAQIKNSDQSLHTYQQQVDSLKAKRRQLSANLQQQLFDQYEFLNIDADRRDVCDIFKNTPFKIPPAGAGDCALPKLLQYAFLHDMRPLAMAEFWWGQSPNSEIRKHGYFYPSCKGKCEPILAHMLKGMRVDESPMLSVSTEEKKLEVVYEDEHLLVVNKPHEFLSVPGKSNADSVLARMEQQYPKATGPLLVHRLDRATSGLLLVAKTKEVHKALQTQFLKRTIKKRYIALLEGEIAGNEGTIDLPLRPDIEDRPRQLVCHVHGKRALTQWKVMNRINNRTLVHLWPLTGRTHQLRMHAAHSKGLNTPMVGDDLYGKTDSRLHLQAAELAFEHPVTEEQMKFDLPPEF